MPGFGAGLSATVYPRACGGTAFPLLYVSVSGGLSPRLRGNLQAH